MRRESSGSSSGKQTIFLGSLTEMISLQSRGHFYKRSVKYENAAICSKESKYDSHDEIEKTIVAGTRIE
ncbi:hypothetical protein PV327_000059, partial [Microctonus hyperodae]